MHDITVLDGGMGRGPPVEIVIDTNGDKATVTTRRMVIHRLMGFMIRLPLLPNGC